MGEKKQEEKVGLMNSFFRWNTLGGEVRSTASHLSSLGASCMGKEREERRREKNSRKRS